VNRNAACAALVMAAACAMRDPRLTGAALPCSSNAQCESDSVCFLGECRGASSQLAFVMAEVHAPADQRLGTIQRSGIDLRSSAVVNFQLQPLLSASGSVQQALDDQPAATDPVAGAGVVLTESAPAIADRGVRVMVQTDSAGAFSATYASSTWNVLVVPPPPAPPIRPPPPAGSLSSSVANIQIVLPASSQLVRIGARILANGNPLPGARVTAVDAGGIATSATATTQADGSFALQLPPGPPPYSLRIGPGTPSDPPIPSFAPLGPFGSSSPPPAVIDVGALPAAAMLSGTVVDARQQPVVAAKVVAVSVDPTGWSISRQGVTDATGAFSIAVRAGQYAIGALPDVDRALPAVSGESIVTAPSTQIRMVCPDKSAGTGVVVRADGTRVGAGYQLAATRVADRLGPARPAASTATDASGSFTIVGDAGRYRLEVVPPASAELPRKIVSVDLGVGAQFPAVQLSSPLTVVGTVTNAAGTPVGGATVDFFAFDSSGTRSVLIGSGLANASGQYRAVLPDVPAPAE
jgi:hypothetical protein